MSGSASFREVLLRAIDDALLVPGEIVRVAIYDRIEKNCQIRHEEIPETLEMFHKALQQLMGVSSRVMEKLIAKNLYRQLSLNFNDHENWTLLDYVDHAKKAHE